MSSTSEEASSSNPLEDLDALAAAPRRERPEPPRLAAIGEGPLSRPFRAEPPRLAASAGDRLETAMSEFVRRQMKPATVPEPFDFKPEAKRRTLVAGAGVAAALAVASLAGLLFVTLFPRDRGLDKFFAAAAKMPRAEDTSNGPLSQARALVPGGGGDQGMNHEQSERLLEQFVQWRQKAASIDKP